MMTPNPFANAYYTMGKLMKDEEIKNGTGTHVRVRLIDRATLEHEAEEQLKHTLEQVIFFIKINAKYKLI